MASGDPPGPPGSPSATPPPLSPPAPRDGRALDWLKDQFLRLLPQMMAHLEDIHRLFCRIRQELQEHQKEVENFFELLETWGPSVRTQSMQVGEVSPEKQPGEASGEPESPQASQVPEATSPPRSNLEDGVAAPLPSWPQWLPELDDAIPPEPQAWAGGPQVWQDVLTQKLWQMFVNNVQNRRQSKQLSTLESEEPGSCNRRTEPSDTADLIPTLAELSSSLTASCKAQEPVGTPCSLVKQISWDPEDFKDTWERPGALPWQCKRFAIPHKVEKVRTLHAGEPVLAMAVSSFTRHAFTCGRGGVKVWSLVGPVAEDRFPDSHLHFGVKARGAYLRTCLLTEDSRTLLTGGHKLPGVCVWDLAAPSLREKDQLACEGLSCVALAARAYEHLAFATFRNGIVRMWDLRDASVVRDLEGHQNGTKSMVIKDRGLWTGGMDSCLRCWDLRAPREPMEFQFESQVLSLAHSAHNDWVLLGLASGEHWLQPTDGGRACAVGRKDGAIHSLKVSPQGQWWVSVGMDSLVTIHSMPKGDTVFQVPETSTILSCDVSSNNRLVVTGSWDQASVYQIGY